MLTSEVQKKGRRKDLGTKTWWEGWWKKNIGKE